MKKSLSFSSVIIVLLLVAVVAMSVGFAAFSSNLDINGTASVESSTWNVKFQEDSYQETSGSVTVDAGNRSISATSMSYSVTLTEPGDFYEFTISVENAGTFDAQLSGITMSSLTAEQAKYLTYTVSYNGNNYNATQSDLNIDLLRTATAPVKVRVEYIQPADPNDLPSSVQSINLNATLNFVQKA